MYKNKKIQKEYTKLYAKTHKDKMRIYFMNFFKKHKNYQKIYFIKNKIKIYQKRNKQRAIKRKTNIKYKILGNIRSRILQAIKNNSKSYKTNILIGCNIAQLKRHIEKQFKKGMNWNNWGVNEKDWQIDHIKPCCSFDLRKKSEQLKCFHYRNLQPLWLKENKIKIKEDKKLLK
jgi:hypothetical protein